MSKIKEQMKISELNEDLKYNLERKSDLKREIDDLRDDLNDFENINEQLKEEVNDYKQRSDNSKFMIANYLDQIRRVVEENKVLQNENENMKEQIISLDTKVIKLEKENKCIVENNISTINQLKNKNENLVNRLKEIENDARKEVENLQSKIKIINNSNMTVLKCDECQITFTETKNLIEHINAYHIKKKDIHCDICKETFLSRDDLRNHIEEEHKKYIKIENYKEKETRLKIAIAQQRLYISEKLMKCKLNENKNKEANKCSCKGSCNIDHGKYTLRKSKCEILVRKYKIITDKKNNENINGIEREVEERENGNIIDSAITDDYNESDSNNYNCDRCEKDFVEENSFINHIVKSI